MAMKDKKAFAKAALAGLVAVAASSALSGCSDKPVHCYGVAKQNPSQPLTTRQGVCQSLADSKVVHLTEHQLEPVKLEPYSSFVKCYGVAASGKNACATLHSACAGSEPTAKAKDAWIAIPEKICHEVGGVVGKINSDDKDN